MDESHLYHLDFFLGNFDAVFEDDIFLEELLNDEGFDLPNDADVSQSPEVPTSKSKTNADPVPAPSCQPSVPSKSRFAKVDENGLKEIIDGSLSKATGRNTIWGVKLFREWLLERGHSTDFEIFPVDQLNDLLRCFYAEVRNGQGQLYSKSTFVGLRAAINRHLRSPPFERDINLMKDKDFHTSNNVFVSMVRMMKKEGLDETKHHSAIPQSELMTIRESFDLTTPIGLFHKIWFDLTLGFARRGNENQVSLRSSSFRVSTDEDGCEFIEMTHSELTKNHRGNLTDSLEPKKRIYATRDRFCPVSSFKKYVSHMHPENPSFFQQPKSNPKSNENVWFTSRGVGKNTLSKMMSDICKNANLSSGYTNHCLRATAVTLLSHAGVEDREICKITGHKNDQSLKSYCTESSTSQKRAYSAILQGNSDNIPSFQKCQRVESSVVSLSGSSSSRQILPSSVMGMFQIQNSTINVNFSNNQ